ncbi:hypothetical protein [Streptomyces sp. NPDC059909]|uniref:hypothetical protein n=1 Tax=Streptomyces sp. NPDC059909 TaxID=3346998 RepID=UPI00365601BF
MTDDWYDTTAETIAAAGAPTQITNSRTWAISWLAAARATRQVPAGVDRGDFQDAALASAVHHALVTLAPDRTEQLDAALHQTLGGIPDGSAEDRGVAAGERQAELVLESREGDGLDPASVNAPFPVPEPAPGVWQPTPPTYAPAAQYGNRLARPFLLESAGQFRLGRRPRWTPSATGQTWPRCVGTVRWTARSARCTRRRPPISGSAPR